MHLELHGQRPISKPKLFVVTDIVVDVLYNSLTDNKGDENMPAVNLDIAYMFLVQKALISTVH